MDITVLSKYIVTIIIPYYFRGLNFLPLHILLEATMIYGKYVLIVACAKWLYACT